MLVPSTGSVPDPNSSTNTSVLLSEFSTIFTMFFRCAENVLSEAVIL